MLFRPDTRNRHYWRALAALVLSLPANFGNAQQAVAENSYQGACFRDQAWMGRHDSPGQAFASVRPCNVDYEPSDTLALQCSSDSQRFSATLDYVPPSGRQSAGPISVRIMVDGQGRIFGATPNYDGMYESLQFEIDHDDPLVEQLASGNSGSIYVNGKTTRFHLRGSRKAIEVLQAGCTRSGIDRDVTKSHSKPITLSHNAHIRNVAGSGFEGMCKDGLKWQSTSSEAGRGVARLVGCGTQSPTLPIEFSCSTSQDKVTIAVPMVQSLPRMLKGPFPVSLYAQGPGMKTADGSNIQDQIRQFQAMRQEGSGKGRLVFEIGEDDPLLQALALGNAGYVNITGRTLGFHLVGAREALTTMREACGLPKLNIAPLEENALAPSRPKQEARVNNCGNRASSLTELAKSVRVQALSAGSSPLPIGKPTTFQWSYDGQLDADCRRPIYLIVTAPKRTRFEGTGFLAIPGGMPGPFEIKHNQDMTRLFFPLHLLDNRKGEFKIKSYAVGALNIEWALVQPKSKVTSPRAREDFALRQEHVSRANKLENVARYTVGKPRIVVRDNFTLDKPKKVIRSNSGEFDVQVFEGFYRVLDAQTGELLIERAGVDPKFSPGSRFIIAGVTDDFPLEVNDLYSQSQIYRGEASSVVWGNGDAFFAPDEHISSGAAKKSSTVLKVQQGLIDNSAVLFQELEYYKTFTTNWLLSIDFEGAVVAVYDTTERLGSDYHDGGKAWRSLVDPSLSSYQLIEVARKQGVDCSPRCSRRLASASVELLDAVGKRGFFSASQLLARKGRGQEGDLPWFLGADQLTMSNEHRTLSIDHTVRYAVTSSGSRLVQTRSATNTATKKQTSDSTSGADLLLRITRFVPGISAGFAGVQQQLVPDRADWWERIPENVSDLKSRIANRSPAAAKLIPDGNSSLRDEEARAGPCFSPEEYAGTANTPIPFPSHRISEGIELKIAKGWGWLFTPACSNGAEGRNSLWLLLGAPNDSAQLIDISFLLRFRVGERVSGKNADGTLQTYSVFANSLGFGSWPEKVDRASVADDRHLVAHGIWPGGRWALVFDLESRMVKTFIRNVENADDFGALAITRDGRTLVQANTNGQLFFYDTSTGKVVLRGVETDDELIIYDENGYYLSSPEGSQFLYLKFPGISGYSSVAQFASTLNRPDAIKAILTSRVPLPNPKLTAPPELRISSNVDGNGSARRVTLDYQTGSEVGLKELIVFVDGRPEQRVPLSGERTQGRIKISLSPEARWISAVAVDRSGYRSIARGQGLPDVARSDRSRLFAITVGTDFYDDPAINQLGAAKRDAANFGQLVSSVKSGLYSDVELTPFLDERRLKAKLLQRLRDVVSMAGPRDTIMLFAAAHGDRGRDGKFYLVTRDTEAANLENTAIAWDEIATAFQGVKARVVVFLDACRSGAAGQSTGTNDDAVAALLSRDAPITVIAASKGRQNSEETNLGGYFTNEIIRAVAVEREQTDTNKNGAIELAELYGAIKPRVVQATVTNKVPGKQTPWIARNQMVGEIPLF